MADPITAPAPTGFTPAGPADFGPTAFYGNRSNDDVSVLLEGRPLAKMTSLHQRQLDIHATIPMHEDVRAAQITKIGHADRIAHLMKHKSAGGFGLDEHAPQVTSERRKLERAEQELKRLTELKETRTVRWNAAAQLDQAVTDWLLRGGIPGNCVLEPVEDEPLSKLLSKADGGRIDAAVARARLRLRELAADLHRVKSAPWPSFDAKAAAKQFIDRIADQGAPVLDGAIEHGIDISFATMRLQSLVYNGPPGAVAYTEFRDAVGLIAWLFRDQLLAKIEAGLDDIACDKEALSFSQRQEMEAQISNDMLAAERAECSLIWHADANGEVIDFRPTTSPQAVLGVALRTRPRAVAPGTSVEHGYDII